MPTDETPDSPEAVGTLETPETKPDAQSGTNRDTVDAENDRFTKAFEGFTTKVGEWQENLDKKITDLLTKVSVSQSGPAPESRVESQPEPKLETQPEPKPTVTVENHQQPPARPSSRLRFRIGRQQDG